MKTTVITAAFLAAAGLAMPAGAELKGRNEITVQAGAMVFEGDARLDMGFIYGARLGHYFTEQFSAEAAVFPGNTVGTRSGIDVAVTYPSLSALYHFRFGKLMPFVQAGAGRLRHKADGAPAESDLAIHWGGGLKYFYTPSFLLRADLNHVIDTKTGKGTHHVSAVLGLAWLFGTSDKEAI